MDPAKEIAVTDLSALPQIVLIRFLHSAKFASMLHVPALYVNDNDISEGEQL
jgi:hypothetical protein